MSNQYAKIKQAPKDLFTPPQPIDVKAKYEDITLNFGKYKGKALKDVSSDDNGPNYLIWLYGEMMKKDSLSPTQKAIVKFIRASCEIN
jgi:uncharacterized protein (DUF3820 family)